MWTKRLWQWVGWLFAVGLLVWSVGSVSLVESWRAVRQVGWSEWGVLFGLNLGVLLLLNGRWWLILRGLGQWVPFWMLLGHRLAGFGVSYFTPGPHFGGEPVQVLLLERQHGVNRETAVASVALDKMLELLVNFTFLVGGVLFVLQAGLLPGQVGWQTAVWGGMLLAIPAGFLGAVWWGKRPFSSGAKVVIKGIRWVMGELSMSQGDASPINHQSSIVNHQSSIANLQTSLAASEAQMTAVFQQSPGVMSAAFLLSLLSWVGILVEYGAVVSFLGLSLSPAQMLLLLVAARIAILLPLPAGIGTLESSQVLGLGLLGLETAVGISITLIIRARDVILGLVGLWWAARKIKR